MLLLQKVALWTKFSIHFVCYCSCSNTAVYEDFILLYYCTSTRPMFIVSANHIAYSVMVHVYEMMAWKLMATPPLSCDLHYLVCTPKSTETRIFCEREEDSGEFGLVDQVNCYPNLACVAASEYLFFAGFVHCWPSSLWEQDTPTKEHRKVEKKSYRQQSSFICSKKGQRVSAHLGTDTYNILLARKPAGACMHDSFLHQRASWTSAGVCSFVPYLSVKTCIAKMCHALPTPRKFCPNANSQCSDLSEIECSVQNNSV